MKARELKELRTNNPQNLKVKLNGLRTKLFNLRFQLATDQLGNPMKIREIEKSIARIRAIIKEEEIRASEQ